MSENLHSKSGRTLGFLFINLNATRFFGTAEALCSFLLCLFYGFLDVSKLLSKSLLTLRKSGLFFRRDLDGKWMALKMKLLLDLTLLLAYRIRRHDR